MKNTTIQKARIDLSNGPSFSFPLVALHGHRMLITWWPTSHGLYALGFTTPAYPNDIFFQTKADEQPFGPEHLDDYYVNHSSRIGDRCLISVSRGEIAEWTKAVEDRAERVRNAGGQS